MLISEGAEGMRTDYKIGIAVVLFLAVVIVVYNLFIPPNAAPPMHSRDGLVGNFERLPAGGEGTLSPGTGFYTPTTDDTVIEGLGQSFVGRGDSPEPSEVRSQAPSTLRRSQRSPGSLGGTSPEPAILSDVPAEVEPAALVVTRPPQVTPPPATPDDRIYVVQKGDHGFWTVAVKEYGDGRNWHLIAQANPSAESNTLRPGQKLKIPALRRTSALRASGQTPRSPDRPYRVQKDDAGFWGVSEKVYGTGKHWARIAQANPDVDSHSLKVGQELIIPPLPTARRPDTSPPSALRSGEQWYTVRAGDAGFWDVAKHAYGAGKYWRKVAEANPDVDSGRLRPGQKLRVPPREGNTDEGSLRASLSP
jgi:nucleoid-associated protein YgaU